MDTTQMHSIPRQLAEYWNRDPAQLAADKATPPEVYARTRGKEFNWPPNTWLRLTVYTPYETFGVSDNLDAVGQDYQQQLTYDKLYAFTNMKPIV